MSETKGRAEVPMQLSIVMPGIRPQLWQAAYDSMRRAYSGQFELIIVAPEEPFPKFLIETGVMNNVRYLADKGSPVRCLAKGISVARAPWIAWASDDGLFEPGSFDAAFELLKNQIGSESHEISYAVTGRYTEGTPETQAGDMLRDDYYYVYGHDDLNELPLPKDYLALNGTWLIHRDDLTRVGGLDCEFETLAIAFNDLAMRLQTAGVEILLQPGCAMKFSHMPGETGDHGPVHRAHFEHDLPLFQELYSKPDQGAARKIMKWNQAPEVWERRFGK